MRGPKFKDSKKPYTDKFLFFQYLPVGEYFFTFSFPKSFVHYAD